jgi:hypothetical protein
MKKISLFAGVMVMAVCFLFTSCGDKGVTDVTGVTLDKTSLSLEIGGTATLTATVSPGDAEDKTVSWKSSNSAVATVSNGKVTAVATGTATITVTTTDGAKTATCNVTVNASVSTSGLQVTFNGTTWEAPAGEVYATIYSNGINIFGFRDAHPNLPMIEMFFPASTGTHVIEADDEGYLKAWTSYFYEYAYTDGQQQYADWYVVEGGTFTITAYNETTKTVSGTYTGEVSNYFPHEAGDAETYEVKPITVSMTNVTWIDMPTSGKSDSEKSIKIGNDGNLRIAKKVAVR